MTNTNIFSVRLKEVRASMNMTQVQFANHVGSNQVTLSAYETGSTNPSLEVVKEIATKCNVSIDWLCGLSDKKTLGNKIFTYKELFRAFVNILDTRYDSEIFPIIDVIDSDTSIVTLTLHEDGNFQKFFTNWCKVFKLYCEDTVDEDFYRAWVESEITKFDRPINGVPF